MNISFIQTTLLNGCFNSVPLVSAQGKFDYTVSTFLLFSNLGCLIIYKQYWFQVKLKISKKFIHTEQKGYVEDDENVENDSNYQCPFIFFLNVGQSTVDESDNTNNSFVMEWLPSVTCVTNIGQLKLQYKYGRKGT